MSAIPDAVMEDIVRYGGRFLPEAVGHALQLSTDTPAHLLVRDPASGLSECFTLPLSFAQLGAFLQRAAQHSASEQPPLSLAQHVVLEPRRAMLRCADAEEVPLTHKEAALLQVLVNASPQPVSRSHLLDDVWRYDEQIDTRTLETHIYRLRQKLEPLGLSGQLETTPEGYLWREKA